MTPIGNFTSMIDNMGQKAGVGMRSMAQLLIWPETRLTLGQKGLLTLAIMVVYFIAVSFLIAYERRSLIDSVQLLNDIHQQEEQLLALNTVVSRAVITVNENYLSPDVEVSSQLLVPEIRALLKSFAEIGQQFEHISHDAAQLNKALTQLNEQPDRAGIADIRNIFHHIASDLDNVIRDTRNRKQWLVQDYRETHGRLTVEWLACIIVGMGCLSGLMWVFFHHIAADILRAQQRATEIVRGYRGTPLPITRHDELGGLIEAVNNMQDELRRHETRLELVRHQQFHKDKMSAVGSLAAAVAHEINNPLAALVGVAQTIIDEECIESCGRWDDSCRPKLIMQQAARVMQITRQISEFSTPHSQEPELLDINGLVRNTCNFVGYDRRFRRIEVIQSLDNNLPAAHVVADQLMQVLMNLLINSADALENCTDRHCTINIRTWFQDCAVRIAVTDNGCGIAPGNLDHIFTENFTTKPPERGSGLGLALCRALIFGAGGSITVESQVAEGTTVTVILPQLVINGTRNNAIGEEQQCTS